MNTMTFKANNQINRPGGWFGDDLPQLSGKMDMLVTLFTEGKTEGHYEPENGYDHPWELAFEGPEGMTFSVYARWGQPRIGVNEKSESHVQEFKAWLLSQVGDKCESGK